MTKILFVGGGSVGHIAPSIAVWEAMPAGHDAHAHFVCSPRTDDAAFLDDNNLSFSTLDAPRASIAFPFKFFTAVSHAKKILETQQPDIIFSKGGYVSLPLCFAAKKKHIPIVMHESDSVSGHANKIVAKWASHICTGFPNHESRITNHHFTGNPLRSGITKGSKEEALRITGFDGTKPILLVIGGSQGAQAINDTILAQLDDLLLRCDIIHITGRGKSFKPSNPQSFKPSNHYYQTEFANQELAHFYAAASLAISRAGANALAELSVNSIPTIVVPLRGVGHDHQFSNTKIASEYGCIHIEQSDLSKQLLPTVHTLIADKKTLQEMGKNFSALSRPDAALQIAKIIAQTLDS